MRTELKDLAYKEILASGTFIRYRFLRRIGYTLRVALIKDLQDIDGCYLADHIWLECKNYKKGDDDLECGDIITFSAFVTSYIRYGLNSMLAEGFDVDFTLTNPTNIRVCSNIDFEIVKKRREIAKAKQQKEKDLAYKKTQEYALNLIKMEKIKKAEEEKKLIRKQQISKQQALNIERKKKELGEEEYNRQAHKNTQQRKMQRLKSQKNTQLQTVSLNSLTINLGELLREKLSIR